ncbi:MAG: hypothetical protein AB1801_02775 [Chloroflexota bacterium]
MAKRPSKHKDQAQVLENRRAMLLRLFWAVVVLICVLFGYSYGFPIAAEGQVVKGILIGLAYGGGALGVILVSFFLNRKLKGL